MEAPAAVARTGVVIKYRKGIRCIAFAELAIGFAMIVIMTLSWLGFFPTREHDPSEYIPNQIILVIFFVTFCVVSTGQAIAAIGLLVDTNEQILEFPLKGLKLWRQTTRNLNLNIIPEIYVFLYILDWEIIMFFTLCCSKFVFRLISILIVDISIRDFNRRTSNVLDAIRIPASSHRSMRNGDETSGNGCSTKAPPPYKDFAPPSFEEATNSVKIEIPIPTLTTSPASKN